MYTKFISKMNNHFSNLGSILYSKACDYSGIYPISKDDIMIYYELLNTDEVVFPENISKNNHIACCLYYLTKENIGYREKFLEKFLRTITFDSIKIDENHLVLIFNIIEFDKTYLNSPKEHISFLYQLLKAFSNFSTNFENYILYKYFRGYLKYRLEDYQSANKEYLEIVSELPKNDLNYLLTYVKLRNDLMKIKIFHNSKLSTKTDFNEYWQFLRDLYNKVKAVNRVLALKFGLDLVSSYLEGKNYNNCIPLLMEMKQLLKKELLNGVIMNNGINYYLAIASRLGYVGILLNNKNAISSAIKKIRKTIEIIKNDKNNEKLVQLVKAYTFVLAIFEINLNKETEYDIKSLAFDFKNTFLPDLESKPPLNYFVTEQNRDNTIIDFQTINNMNPEIISSGRNILNKCISEINKKNYSNSNFLTFMCAVHSKVNIYSQSYITDKNETKRKYYKNRIIEYIDFSFNIIYKLLDEEPLLYTSFIKSLIIEIFSAYAHIFIYDKNFPQLRTSINTIDDMKKKLNFDDSIPSYALIYKIKGDYWLYKKDYKASISYYESALNIFEKNNIKIPQVLFNKGCAHFFNGEKAEAVEYLNRCINEYNNVLLQKNTFGFNPDINSINNKISEAKKLLSLIPLK